MIKLYMSNGKVLIIHVILGLMEEILWYKVSYFPGPYDHSKNEIKVDLNLSNSATNLT